MNEDINFKASAKSPSWSLGGPVLFDNSLAQYTGGEVRVEKNFDLSLSVVPMPELAHVSIGMESVDFKVGALCCLISISDSFSLSLKCCCKFHSSCFAEAAS